MTIRIPDGLVIEWSFNQTLNIHVYSRSKTGPYRYSNDRLTGPFDTRTLLAINEPDTVSYSNGDCTLNNNVDFF